MSERKQLKLRECDVQFWLRRSWGFDCWGVWHRDTVTPWHRDTVSLEIWYCLHLQGFCGPYILWTAERLKVQPVRSFECRNSEPSGTASHLRRPENATPNFSVVLCVVTTVWDSPAESIVCDKCSLSGSQLPLIKQLHITASGIFRMFEFLG
jgi:hypothetical protein